MTTELKPANPLDELRQSIRRLTWALIATSVLQVLVMAVVVVGGVLLIERRQDNCEQIRAAFRSYTTALVQVSDSSTETVEEFTAAYEPQLDRCN